MKIKKIAAIALSATMMLGSCLTVSAAPSMVQALDPNQVTASEGEVSIVEKAVEEFREEFGEEAASLAEVINEATVNDTLDKIFESVLEADVFEELEVRLFEDNEDIGIADLSLLKVLSPVIDLQITGITPTAENPVEVTFTANNMTDDIDVYALHLCEEHGWEVLRTEVVSGNQVKAPFHSLSPVALVYADKTDDKADITAPETK